MICPTCQGVPGGCASCEGAGVVAMVVEREVTFAQACVLIAERKLTGQIHVLHGTPKLLTVAGQRVKIVA